MSHEVLGRTVLGASFALFAALSLVWISDDPDQDRKPARRPNGTLRALAVGAALGNPVLQTSPLRARHNIPTA